LRRVVSRCVRGTHFTTQPYLSRADPDEQLLYTPMHIAHTYLYSIIHLLAIAPPMRNRLTASGEQLLETPLIALPFLVHKLCTFLKP
jgi:hypothetical protein